MRIPILSEIGNSDEKKGAFGLKELRNAIGLAEDKELEMYMATPGGSVAMADIMLSEILEKKKEGYTVTAILGGEVASAGSYLMLAADKIKAYPQVRVMIHNAWGEIEGNQHEIQAYMERLKSIDNTMASLYASKTGKTAEEMLAYMQEEKWFTAQEALAIGLIDEIIPMTPKAMDVAEVYASWRKPATVHIDVDTTQANTLIEQFKDLFNQSKTEMGKFKNQLNAVLAKVGIKAEVKAMDITLEDGNILRVDSETEDLIGKTAVVIDSEGNESAAPDGSHTDSNGRVITTEGGVVTSVTEPTEDASAKIAALEAELADATAALQTALATIEAQAKATTTTPAAGVRTAAPRAAGAPASKAADQLDLAGAYASAKGISRAEAEQIIARNAAKKK